MNGKTFKPPKEAHMKLYVGIRKAYGHLSIVALDNHGVAVLKNQFPFNTSGKIILKTLASLKDAFKAPLRIAISQENSIDFSLINSIEKEHGKVILVKPSLLYSTDFTPDDSLHFDRYRYAIHLAILRSLAD